MRLAIHNLLYEPIRMVLSIGGIALAIMLIVLLSGLETGMSRQIAAYLEQAPGSVVVAQAGVENFLVATSSLPAGTAEEVRATAPDAQVVPILSQFIVLDLHGSKQPVYLIGYQPGVGGGPWDLAAGREPATDDEIVLDRVLADRHRVGLADAMDLMGQRFTISGLSAGTTSWMTSFVFVRQSAAETLLSTPGVTSFLLLTPSTDSSTAELADRLAQLPGTAVLTKADLISRDVRLYRDVFSPPIRLMSAIAFLVGSLVVGLVIYTATVERRREYGVLKALGAHGQLLYRIVVVQALALALAGVGLGLGVAVAGAQLIMWLRPQFLVTFAFDAVVIALLSGLLMALAAALVPSRVIAGLAPADVFRR